MYPLTGLVEQVAQQCLLAVGAGLGGLTAGIQVASHVVRLDGLDQHSAEHGAQPVQLNQVVALVRAALVGITSRS